MKIIYLIIPLFIIMLSTSILANNTFNVRGKSVVKEFADSNYSISHKLNTITFSAWYNDKTSKGAGSVNFNWYPAWNNYKRVIVNAKLSNPELRFENDTLIVIMYKGMQTSWKKGITPFDVNQEWFVYYYKNKNIINVNGYNVDVKKLR